MKKRKKLLTAADVIIITASAALTKLINAAAQHNNPDEMHQSRKDFIKSGTQLVYEKPPTAESHMKESCIRTMPPCIYAFQTADAQKIWRVYLILMRRCRRQLKKIIPADTLQHQRFFMICL